MKLMEEMPARILLDGWSILYKNLAACVLERYGRSGEAAVRGAVHLCGEKMGALERDAQAAQGRRANLLSCFAAPQVLCPDPRFHVKWQLRSEQEAVFDVLSCPIRNLLSENGGAGVQLLFCEEYLHGCIMGYTEGTGQCCFSEDFAFPGENSCRFSCYFRPANLPPEARPLRFGPGTPPDPLPPEPDAPVPDSRPQITRWASLLVEAFRTECTGRLGPGALCAVAAGLKAAAEETSGYCRSICRLTRQRFDSGFAAESCLWDPPPCADGTLSREAAALIEINYCRTLRAALDQC